jgi:voltage-gated potassium channel
MSALANRDELPPAKRRRLLGLRLLRALATTVVLVALYYLLPLDHIPKNVPLTLAAGLLILLAVTVWQVRAIIRARYPALRAAEALAATVPLFLLLFASAYFTMARTNPASFSAHSLTRTDALYFTVTVFSTVGFGDITAVSQSARLVVTAQMLLDLLVLGLGIRVFAGAIQREAAGAPGRRSGYPARTVTTPQRRLSAFRAEAGAVTGLRGGLWACLVRVPADKAGARRDRRDSSVRHPRLPLGAVRGHRGGL